MNEFRIVGESKPNKIKLKSVESLKITELPKRSVRRMVDIGVINVTNPEILYHQI